MMLRQIVPLSSMKDAQNSACGDEGGILDVLGGALDSCKKLIMLEVPVRMELKTSFRIDIQQRVPSPVDKAC